MPIRTRIALATAAIMTVSLFILSAGVYFTMSRLLHDDLEARLRNVHKAYRENPGTWYRAGRIVFLELEPEPAASSGAYIQILDSAGNMEDRSDNLGELTLPVETGILARNANSEGVYYTAHVNGQPLRVYSAPVEVRTPTGTVPFFVQVAEPLGPVNSTLAGLLRYLVIGSTLATLALTVAAWFVAGTAMRPLALMSNTARTIGRTGDLSRRLQPPRTGDEVQQLGEAFNEVLVRLEENANAQRRFVADASHELRTPLTALRANSEIMLRQSASGVLERDDLVEGLTDIRDEVDRMSRLVQNLLTLARADVGWRPELEPVDLVEIARDAARKASPLLRGQHFEVVIPPHIASVDDHGDILGNADQLTQLVLILLDNAFTHTPTGSTVWLRVFHEDGAAVLVVSDTGPGIEAAHLDRIFERFYRTDDARTRASGGTGLGLAIARWIVAVHGGSIDVESEPGRGASFTVRLPLIADDGVTSAERRERAPAQMVS